MIWLLRVSFLGTFLLQMACASHRVIRDREYEASVAAYQRGDAPGALEKFPEGENQGFITSIERAWLSVWDSKWDPGALQKQVATFDQRRFTSISREAGYFLLQESEEGYVPSEHEVVLLHLISAIHYTELGKEEDAAVELRRAGYVLDRYWDDASLRIWLGSLWAALGFWDEAQVDFRRAGDLSHNKALTKLADGPPPPQLTLQFFGNGPTTQWVDGSYEPTFLEGPLEPKNMEMHFSTQPWFQRHTQRNGELRELLVKSNFMAQYLGSKALTGAERGINKFATWGIRVGAVIVGLAVVGGTFYLLTQMGASTGGGELVAYALAGIFGATYGVWTYGRELDHELEREAREGDRRKQEDLRIYRMVRFMPTWLALVTSVPTELSEGRATVKIKTNHRTQLVLLNNF